MRRIFGMVVNTCAILLDRLSPKYYGIWYSNARWDLLYAGLLNFQHQTYNEL